MAEGRHDRAAEHDPGIAALTDSFVQQLGLSPENRERFISKTRRAVQTSVESQHTSSLDKASVAEHVIVEQLSRSPIRNS